MKSQQSVPKLESIFPKVMFVSVEGVTNGSKNLPFIYNFLKPLL
jgi:hypothetical protein